MWRFAHLLEWSGAYLVTSDRKKVKVRNLRQPRARVRDCTTTNRVTEDEWPVLVTECPISQRAVFVCEKWSLAISHALE